MGEYVKLCGKLNNSTVCVALDTHIGKHSYIDIVQAIKQKLPPRPECCRCGTQRLDAKVIHSKEHDAYLCSSCLSFCTKKQYTFQHSKYCQDEGHICGGPDRY